jgi:aspartate aminotransferase
MNLSERVEAIEPSATFAIKAAAAALRADGRDVVDLSAGEPDGRPPEGVVDAAVAALEAGQHQYAPVAGLPALRSAIAQTYRDQHGLDYGPQNVLVTFGGKQALASLALALYNPGDEVIVFAPYWVSYLPQLQLAGAVPVIIQTRPEDGFQPDPAAVAAAITPRTRGMILNSPSNPTGAVTDRERLVALLDLAKKADIAVISDEIYAAITYEGTEAVCVPTLSDDALSRTIIIDAVSKTYAMTGWRVGWMVGPEAVLKAAGKLQGHSTSGVCRINQAGALAAVTADRGFFPPVKAALLTRRDLAVSALNAIPGVDVGPVPLGAFYLFPRVDGLFGKTSPQGRKLDSALSVADFLIHEGGVAVVPGEAFGEARCVRISYAISREQLASGLSRLAEAVSTLV